METRNEPPPGDAEAHRARATAPRPPVRMCVRCHVTTESPVVVRVVHQNSGPGFTVYACQTCAPHFTPPEVP
jgi:hypothetical protein